MLERWVPERAERTPIASWTDAAGSPAGLPATGYALSPNGHFFVAAENGEVRRWSLVDGTAKRLPAPADWRGKDLALSNDGASLAVWERRVTLPLDAEAYSARLQERIDSSTFVKAEPPDEAGPADLSESFSR